MTVKFHTSINRQNIGSYFDLIHNIIIMFMSNCLVCSQLIINDFVNVFYSSSVKQVMSLEG